jgi:HK97 family phage major capsid protein
MPKRTQAPPTSFPGDVPATGFRAGTITVTKRAKDPADTEEGDGAEEYDVSLSSEEPVGRWFGNEILDHSAKSVDLTRAEQGLPLLKNHDSYGALPIGRIHGLKAAGGKLRGTMTFAPTADGKDAKALVDFGHREMSVGYSVDRYEVTEGRGDAPSTYRATRWTPLEASLVSVPADHTIGVGRNGGRARDPIVTRAPDSEPASSTETLSTPAAPAATSPGVVTMPETAAPTGNGRDEAAEILLRASRHGVPTDEAAQWIRDGITLAQASEKILARVSTPPTKQPAAELQLTEKEAKQYSYCRAILAAADERNTGGFEREISQELEKTLPVQYARKGGMLIPTSLRGIKHPQLRQELTPHMRAALDDFMTRAGGSGTIDSATSNAIKEVVFTVYGGELIEFLRNQARVVECGARVLTGLSSPVAFPRQTADNPAVWVAENPGSDMSRGNVTTDLVTLSPKTLQAATAFSRQLLVQSSVDVEAMVRASIGYAHALAWDLAAIHGSGSSNQPTGIYLASGVGVEDFTSTPTTGHQLQYPFLVDMENKVATANALRGSLCWLTNPGVAKSAKTKLEFPAVNGSAKIWTGPILDGEMDGYPAHATNQVSKTMTSPGLAASGGSYYGLIFGNWADLLIGQFGGAMELVVDPYTLKLQGMIDVASFQMVDIQVRHGPSFCVSKALDATV